jgi:RND family efflux transporter MFP subunit
VWIAALAGGLLTSASCTGASAAKETGRGNASQGREIAVVRVSRKPLERTLTVSSELIPFQQIDVYAKESGFVQKLNVDYGTHVTAGQVMAVLEIPELEAQVDEDDADIKDATGQVARAEKEVNRLQAQYKVAHLEFMRISSVADSQPGLVAQQEVDNWQGKDLAAEAQVQGAQNNLESAKSQLARSQARRHRDQVLFDYSTITAPFSGVVTQRYANLGTLMQAGTGSSTQALPLVQLSEDDLFRLVIPVPESYVRYVRIGDPVDVRVPSLNRTFPGKVARFSVDVQFDTRTMHTEVDVANPGGALVPGVYAEATLTLDQDRRALSVPQQALNVAGNETTVWVVDPSRHLQERKITTGIETPDDVEILSGLSEGDLVAVGDRSSLTKGELVSPHLVNLIQPPHED